MSEPKNTRTATALILDSESVKIYVHARIVEPLVLYSGIVTYPYRYSHGWKRP